MNKITLRGVAIGDQFIPKGKAKKVYTVIDFLTTRNMKGEVVEQACVAEHEFLGQKIISRHPFSTIVLNKISS